MKIKIIEFKDQKAVIDTILLGGSQYDEGDPLQPILKKIQIKHPEFTIYEIAAIIRNMQPYEAREEYFADDENQTLRVIDSDDLFELILSKDVEELLDWREAEVDALRESSGKMIYIHSHYELSEPVQVTQIESMSDIPWDTEPLRASLEATLAELKAGRSKKEQRIIDKTSKTATKNNTVAVYGNDGIVAIVIKEES